MFNSMAATVTMISSRSDEMLPPICLEFKFDKRPLLAYCTFKVVLDAIF